MLGCGLPTHIKAIFDLIWFVVKLSTKIMLLLNIRAWVCGRSDDACQCCCEHSRWLYIDERSHDAERNGEQCELRIMKEFAQPNTPTQPRPLRTHTHTHTHTHTNITHFNSYHPTTNCKGPSIQLHQHVETTCWKLKATRWTTAFNKPNVAWWHCCRRFWRQVETDFRSFNVV